MENKQETYNEVKGLDALLATAKDLAGKFKLVKWSLVEGVPAIRHRQFLVTSDKGVEYEHFGVVEAFNYVLANPNYKEEGKTVKFLGLNGGQTECCVFTIVVECVDEEQEQETVETETEDGEAEQETPEVKESDECVDGGEAIESSDKCVETEKEKPDYVYIESLKAGVTEKEAKIALETYGKQFGVDLKRNMKFENMVLALEKATA